MHLPEDNDLRQIFVFVADLFLDPFYLRGLTLIPGWISTHMPNKVWDEITGPFPNFNAWIGPYLSGSTGILQNKSDRVITTYTI